MRDLKKTIFTLNLGAIFITYNQFFGEVAKEYMNQKYGASLIEAGRQTITKVENSSEELTKFITNMPSQTTMSEEYHNLITQHVNSISTIQERQQNVDQLEAHKEELRVLLSKFNGSGSSQFTENITQLILEYQDLISSLSLIQKLTLINMLTGVLILNCLLTLIAVFYGESLIIYLNLENKFPRFTKFIKLRSKFQQFYFFVNSIIIIIAMAKPLQ